MQSLERDQETYRYLDTSVGASHPTPVSAGQTHHAQDKNEVDQMYMSAAGGHGRREGKITDAITLPTVAAKDSQFCQRSPSEAVAAADDDDNVYEPIIPKEEGETADEHTYQPLIPPILPVRPDVQYSGETTHS